MFIEVDNRTLAADYIDSDLSHINNWAAKWFVTFSPAKTKSLIISTKSDLHRHPKVKSNGQVIEEVSSHTYLGLKFARNLRWGNHINDLSISARKRLNMMIPLKFKIDRKSLETMYFSFVLPTMEYANIIWGGSYNTDLDKLEKIHIDGMRLITGATAHCNITNLYTETNYMPVRNRIDKSMLIMIFKIKHGFASPYLVELLPENVFQRTNRKLRSHTKIAPIGNKFIRLELFRKSFFAIAIEKWNKLPSATSHITKLITFKKAITKDLKKPNDLY